MLRRLALVAFISVFSTSCATSSYIAFGRCVSEKVHIDAIVVVDLVQTAFHADDYLAELARLGITYGPAAVECAIDVFINREGKKLSLRPDEATALDRARSYRAVHP